MDRIRMALDLARQERDRAADPEPGVQQEPLRTPNKGLPANIEYTKTRVVTLDRHALEARRIVDPDGNTPAAAGFRMLRTQVIQRMDEHHWQSVAVLSPGRSDGKTTTAVNLALSMANDRRHTVLLVDCDLKNPTIASTLGISAELGVDDILRGEARIEDCLCHPDGFGRLVVLPARAMLVNSSEALAGPQGRALVADLRGRYPERIIVFDLPPILGADDALAFLPLIECGLVVVAEHGTRRDELLRSMELLRKTPILGTVLNKAADAGSTYG
jgi:Mrp family chromosome partitioning ATPase